MTVDTEGKPIGHGGVPRRCSFCGKLEGQVEQIVSAGQVHICASCVELCAEEIAAMRGEQASSAGQGTLPRPRELGVLLDRYVVGQEQAKRSLAVAVYNHYKRIRAQTGCPLPGEEADVELAKSNILLLGPPGSGKTLLAQTLARILDVPFVIVDATGLTEAGYVGEDVNGILMKLLQAADHDIGRAQTGIIYIDEIDKIARRGDGSSTVARDVSGEGVQQALLKMLEGAVMTVSPPTSASGSRSRTSHEGSRIDTTEILFIVAGAFASLATVVEARLRMRSTGFRPDSGPVLGRQTRSQLLAQVTPEDLAAYGMIPEFIGRLPMITSVDELDRDALLRVLTEPRNALVRQYERLLAMDGKELVFEKAALEAIAERAISRGAGARGLRSILDGLLLRAMYDVPSLSEVARVVVTEDSVRKGAPLSLRRTDDSIYEERA